MLTWGDRRWTSRGGGSCPHFKHLIVQQFVIGPYLVMHERLTSMADGKVHDALDIVEVQHGQVVREWESRR